MSDFEIDIRAWVEKTKVRLDEVVRRVSLQLTTEVVLMSPVGNPELWAANAEAVMQRGSHNAVVDQINANLASDPRNLTPKGNLKRSVRSRANRKLSKSQLAKEYPLTQGNGYVGGRFRSNWNVSVGQPNTSTSERVVDASQVIDEAAAVTLTARAGDVVFISNNLPYAQRLEEGWSKQAPHGMVKITVARFQSIVDAAVANLP